MTTIPQKLAHLARLYGVQTSYRDMRRQRQEAPVESLLAVLRLLGAEVNGMDDVDAALALRNRELWERVVEPVVVAWDGKLPPIPVRTPQSLLNATLRSRLTLAGGETQSTSTPLSKLLIRNQQEVGKTRYVERELTIGRPLPSGYHRLTVELNGRGHEIMIISAPMKAFFPFERKEWGVFAPVYALHSKRNPHAGDLTDFETMVDWIGVLGGRVAATLPLLASYLDEPFEPSPYSPASRLFWNEFYVDVGQTRRAAQSEFVDYRKEMAFRRKVLSKDADAFFKAKRTETRDRFNEFVKSDGELQQYARFRAVTDRFRKGWTLWPERLRAGQITPADFETRDERYHLYAQWRIQDQLRQLGQKTKRTGQLLNLDLPLGLHPDSYDIWRFRDQFVSGADGGAPPDPVFTSGQNWAFPPMHPDVVRLRHHQYTIAYLRNHFRYSKMLRIDHVMGLHRLFWIPHGFTGDKGVYVDYPADELYAILSIESHRYQAGVVGENLGTVPPEVSQAMQRHNIQQMYVLQYEVAGDDARRALRSVPDDAAASLNTHDMAPFRAFLDAADVDDRLELQLLDKSAAKEERLQRARIRKALIEFLQHKHFLDAGSRVAPDVIFKAATQFLAASLANVVLVNIEDLWGETHPQNVPSTSRERPNWKRKTRLSVEEIEGSKEAAEILRIVEKGRRLRR